MHDAIVERQRASPLALDDAYLVHQVRRAAPEGVAG